MIRKLPAGSSFYKNQHYDVFALCWAVGTLERCFILIPDTRSAGSSSMYWLFRAFSGSSSSSFSFPTTVLGRPHQYEG